MFTFNVLNSSVSHSMTVILSHFTTSDDNIIIMKCKEVLLCKNVLCLRLAALLLASLNFVSIKLTFNKL